LATFHGTFEHTLDTKKRLTVPAKFRAALSGSVFLVRGADPCISIYPANEYTEMADAALKGLNPLSPQAKELKRYFYGNAADQDLDSAGRVMLRDEHLAHAGIERDVVVTGAGDCLEVWDRSSWEDYHRDLTARAPELTAALGHPA
jgi:MraZ protein